jgi:hypothetical protein
MLFPILEARWDSYIGLVAFEARWHLLYCTGLRSRIPAGLVLCRLLQHVQAGMVSPKRCRRGHNRFSTRIDDFFVPLRDFLERAMPEPANEIVKAWAIAVWSSWYVLMMVYPSP